MIIKHLYKNDIHVANAYLHKRNATVDIKWLDSLKGADTSIELHEYDEYSFWLDDNDFEEVKP